MELVRKLIVGKFYMYNVGSNKALVTKSGLNMKDWEKLTYEDLLKQHNFNSNLWGMKLGLQFNGRRVLSLDFDICGKPERTTGVRTPCPLATAKLDKLLANYESRDGSFCSSTEGNMNMLVDYTNSALLCAYVERIGATKFNFHELEVILNSNQAIPPSMTISKLTNNLGPARSFF